MAMSANHILEREFLEIRAKILEVGASLDRMERAEGSVAGDDRITLIHQGLEILAGSQENKAEQIQRLFSREYESDWREKFDLTQR